MMRITKKKKKKKKMIWGLIQESTGWLRGLTLSYKRMGGEDLEKEREVFISKELWGGKN